jgi:hypothetical protein
LLLLSYLLFGLSSKEKAGLERSKWVQEKGFGYFKEQSTQPQTLGYSLADSPVGLLGWIYEKLVNWTDEYPWTEDEGNDNTLPLNFYVADDMPSSFNLDLHLLVF